MPDEASPAVPSTPEELALNAGRMVARLHFLNLNEGIARENSRHRLDCLSKIEETLISLFPSSRGGKPRKLAERLRETSGFFLDQNFCEEYLDRIETECRSRDPNVDLLGRALALIVPDESADLLKSLHKACSRRRSLRAWIRLGVCLEEGLCPPDATSAFLKFRWSREHGPMPAEWLGTSVPGIQKLEFDAFVRAVSPGVLPIKDLWINEVTEQLRNVDSLVDPASLAGMKDVLGSERVAFLNDFVKQVVQDFRRRTLQVAKVKVAKVVQVAKVIVRRGDLKWVHDAGETPPEEFPAGPLIGTKTELGIAIRMPNKLPPKQEKSYRGDLKRAASAKTPRIWLRRSMTNDQFEASFRDLKALHDAQEQLKSFPKRRKTIAEDTRR